MSDKEDSTESESSSSNEAQQNDKVVVRKNRLGSLTSPTDLTPRSILKKQQSKTEEKRVTFDTKTVKASPIKGIAVKRMETMDVKKRVTGLRLIQ